MGGGFKEICVVCVNLHVCLSQLCHSSEQQNTEVAPLHMCSSKLSSNKTLSPPLPLYHFLTAPLQLSLFLFLKNCSILPPCDCLSTRDPSCVSVPSFSSLRFLYLSPCYKNFTHSFTFSNVSLPYCSLYPCLAFSLLHSVLLPLS